MDQRLSPPLGTRMFSRGIVLKGKMATTRWQHFLRATAEALGMSPVDDPAMWKFPIADGKGGHGFTICQPITESFLILDVWTEHDGAYLFVCSCKTFAVQNIRDVAHHFGLVTRDMTDLEELALV